VHLLCTSIRRESAQLCTGVLSRGVPHSPCVWNRGVQLIHCGDDRPLPRYMGWRRCCMLNRGVYHSLPVPGSAEYLSHVSQAGECHFSTIGPLSIYSCMLHIVHLTLTPVVLGSRLSSVVPRRLSRGSVLERVRTPGRSDEI
jgi:hypothetical protein